MIKSKIEIISRNVHFPGNGILQFPYQHLFLLYTKEGDIPISVSAGPKGGNYLTGDIYVKISKYMGDNKEFKHCTKFQCFAAIQIEGGDSEVTSKWSLILERTEHINAAEVDYDNALICETPINFLQMMGEDIDRTTMETFTSEISNVFPYSVKTNLCNTINSNTVVRELLEYAGITKILPKYPNGKSVDAPGWDSNFDNDVLDIHKHIQEYSFNPFNFVNFDASQNAGEKPKKEEGRFYREFLLDTTAKAFEVADRVVEAQRQMQEEGVNIPPSAGDYIQDAFDVISHSEEIMRKASLISGEVPLEKEDL